MSDYLQYISVLAALFSLGAGLLAFFKPLIVASDVKLEAPTPLGLLEMRSAFGGCFIGIALVCLVTGHPYTYLAFGGFWLGGALGKFYSTWVDRPAMGRGLFLASRDAVIGLALLSGYCFHSAAV